MIFVPSKRENDDIFANVLISCLERKKRGRIRKKKMKRSKYENFFLKKLIRILHPISPYIRYMYSSAPANKLNADG